MCRLTDESGDSRGDVVRFVEVVMLRFAIEARSTGCMHLVLESVSARAPYLLENRSSHPLHFRQAYIDGNLWQALPQFSAAGYAWQSPDRGHRREVLLLLDRFFYPAPPFSS